MFACNFPSTGLWRRRVTVAATALSFAFVSAEFSSADARSGGGNSNHSSTTNSQTGNATHSTTTAKTKKKKDSGVQIHEININKKFDKSSP
jgi:type VI protein secretion system component Hcp